MREATKPWEPACAEYFERFAEGRYDDEGQYWFIFSETEIAIETDKYRNDLVVGSPGCDGIDFCFRHGRTGVWAYYPIESEHVLVAPNLEALAHGWLSGSITV